MEQKLFTKIKENWPIKIICVAIAIFIYVFHSISSLEKKVFDVPLEITNDGVMTTASFIPKFAKVTIRTTPENMLHINPGTMLHAQVFLNDYTAPGQLEVPVRVEVLGSSILTDPLEISVMPEKVSLMLDFKTQKYIQIEPMVAGAVDNNFKITNIKVNPSSVKVVGPKSIIDNMKQIYTTKVNVKGAVKSFTTTVRLDETTPLIKVFPEGVIHATVSIDYRTGTKVYEKVQMLITGLSDTLEIENAVPLISFEVEGPNNEIAKYKLSDKTVSINCSAIKAAGRYDLPVIFFFPPKLSLKVANIQKVSIQVIEKAHAQDVKEEDASMIDQGSMNKKEEEGEPESEENQ